MDVSRASLGVLVCTYTPERIDQLVAALASVGAQTRPPDEVLVVVDGAESLAELVRSVVPDVKLLCLGRNHGVSVARTRGVEALGTDLVVFLDDDAVAEPTWLERLLEPMADPGVIGASGTSVAEFAGPRPGWLADEFLWVVGCSYRGLPTAPARVRNFFGGCALVRRELFLEVGGFASDIGHHGTDVGGGEEAEFCLRATAAAGGAFAFEPAAVIRHRVPTSRLTWRYYLRRCHDEGRMKIRLARRHPRGALGPERAFARRMPLAVLEALRRGRPARAAGIVAGCVAVLVGMARG